VDEDWRVETTLSDEGYGHSLHERLHARSLGEHARRRLGEGVVVTRTGSKLFVYTADQAQANEAGELVRELVAEEDLSADVTVTRWHPVEESWKDASVPLPATEEERAREEERMEAAEEREAAEEGAYDWEVHAQLHDRRATVELARRLASEGFPVIRRWKYVGVGALSEEQAHERAELIRLWAPPETRVEVHVNTGLRDRPLFLVLWHPPPRPPEQ